jgi:hypothetical protein
MADPRTDWVNRLAQYDLDEATIRRILAQKLALNTENRAKSLVTGRENHSARGILNSTIALDDQTERNTEYTRADADLNSSANDGLAQIGIGRGQADADYYAALAEIERQNQLNAGLLEPAPEPAVQDGPTAEDPLNWLGIKKLMDQAAAEGRVFDPEDPYNWKGIEQERILKGMASQVSPGLSASNPAAHAKFGQVLQKNMVPAQSVMGSGLAPNPKFQQAASNRLRNGVRT